MYPGAMVMPPGPGVDPGVSWQDRTSVGRIRRRLEGYGFSWQDWYLVIGSSETPPDLLVQQEIRRSL